MGSFQDLNISKQFRNALQDMGISDPTPIQQKAIPRIQAGHDVIGIAQTGTGKTIAYLLPVLGKANYAQGEDPRVLILAPTRELVLQISDEVEKLTAYTDLRAVALYGGIGPKQQIEAMESGVDILVSTPGRFLDIYSKGGIFTKYINTMVLDEADKMMDMGFMPQIRRILEVIPVKRQNLLFSATMPPKVEILSEEFLEFPEKVEVTPQATAVETVEQRVYAVPNFRTKINLLEYLLLQEDFDRVIIFARTRANADNLYKFLHRKTAGEVRVIHANKGQNTRINAINAFKEGDVRILVATDVAARGIDVKQVSHVINFDLPQVYEDYVHRIGRTGRAHETGVAITFANEAEREHLKRIEKIIRQPIETRPLPPTVGEVPTPREEAIAIARDIDRLKRKENPDFKGAFHEKKQKPHERSSGRRKRKK